ncbi:MAG: hypothetical protein IPM39_23730 [Chloroflexi bacterium]|nr:hypothetical protein [Chloroflexota bacterium]
MSKDAPHEFRISDFGSKLSELYYKQLVLKNDKCNVFFVKNSTNVTAGLLQNNIDWQIVEKVYQSQKSHT